MNKPVVWIAGVLLLLFAFPGSGWVEDYSE
jgi:hypothetical protein